MQVAQKVLVVTGGGNGIGRETVLALLARRARVAAVDVSEDGLAQTAALAAAHGDRLSTHRVDLTSRDAVGGLRTEVLARHGQVDGVVNLAGIIQPFVRVAELRMEDMHRVMDVNFWGTVHVVTALLPDLLERPAACVVNVSSMGALAPVPGQAVYGASKAAVTLFTEALYAELMGTSVAVTVVFPGAVATGIAQNSGAVVPGAGGDPDAASRPKMSLTEPDDAARQIVDGIEEGAFRVVVGRDARMIDLFARLSPRRATETIAKRMASLLG